MVKMLAVFICLSGIFIIVQTGEYFWRHKILRGEYLRKFIHILSAGFIAFWPWLISWKTIEIIGVAMLAVVLLNHRHKTFHMDGDIRRQTYGGMLFAVAVILCAALTNQPVFFAIAILHLGLADGFAAVAGEYYKKLRYKVFGYRKSVYGSMVFWLVSLCILSFGLLFVNDSIPFNHYALTLFALPPTLTLLENISIAGFDNLTVPVTVVLVLRLVS